MLRYLICFALASGISAGTSLKAESPWLINRLLQDELEKLPADYTAFMNSAQQVNIQLELLAAVDAGFEETLVTVVTPDGKSREFEADENGLVTIAGAEEGPHAIVASNQQGHGTSLLFFKKPDPTDAIPEERQRTPAKMTLVKVTPDELKPFVDDMKRVSGPREEYRTDIARAPSYGYRARLDENGNLQGKVVSVLARDVSLRGTNISILKDGRTVSTTTSDADGGYEVAGLQPGVYGLIANGPAGHAAFSIEVLDSPALVMHRETVERLVRQFPSKGLERRTLERRVRKASSIK